MNKLSNAQRKDFRWLLLSTVSAAALLVSAYGAQAADTDRPLLWVELGGQLSQLNDSQEAYMPPFAADIAPAGFTSPSVLERPSRFSLDKFGSISFQGDGSDWIFSASIRYGRSSSNRDLHQQTTPTKLYPWPPPFTRYFSSRARSVSRFAETTASNSEGHDIIDFQAGKDVGLGMFGSGGSSVLGLGVRYAQLNDKSRSRIKADTDARMGFGYFTYLPYYDHLKLPAGDTYHSNFGVASTKRSFHGVGPSISWKASAPFAGEPQDGQLTLDWGVNAALLFGRQRARTRHETKSLYHGAKYASAVRVTAYDHPYNPPARSRSVTVPNVGGFAGLSYRYSDAKLSLGYRADFFFGAMDGGIDTRKSENRGFYGPFASISVGVGD